MESGGEDLAGGRVKAPYSVKGCRPRFCRGVPLALARQHMQEHGLIVDGRGHVQMPFQGVQIVPVDRTDIVEAKRLKQHARREHGLETAVRALGVGGDFLPDARDGLEQVLDFLAHPARPAAFHVAAEKERERSHVGRNGHFIVVEHDNEPAPHVAGLVQPFKGKPGGEGAIADHGQNMVFQTGEIARQRHAERRRHRCGGMADAEMIVPAFFRLGKAADPAQTPQGVEHVRPAGEQLPGVALVAHIPDHLVLFRIEDRKQGDGQLHHAKRRRKVASVGGYRPDDAFTQFAGKMFLFLMVQTGHIGRPGDPGKDRRCAWRGLRRVVHQMFLRCGIGGRNRVRIPLHPRGRLAACGRPTPGGPGASYPRRGGWGLAPHGSLPFSN